jgi:hypothetical protein
VQFAAQSYGENANDENPLVFQTNEFHQNNGREYDKLFSKFSDVDNGRIPIDFEQNGNNEEKQQRDSQEYHQMVNVNGKIMNNKGKWEKNGKY